MVAWMGRFALLIGVYFESGFVTAITFFYVFCMLEGLLVFLKKENKETLKNIYGVE